MSLFWQFKMLATKSVMMQWIRKCSGVLSVLLPYWIRSCPEFSPSTVQIKYRWYRTLTKHPQCQIKTKFPMKGAIGFWLKFSAKSSLLPWSEPTSEFQVVTSIDTSSHKTDAAKFDDNDDDNGMIRNISDLKHPCVVLWNCCLIN